MEIGNDNAFVNPHQVTSLGIEHDYTEQQKRWLSWNLLVDAGKKHSYAGTVPKVVVERRRAKNRVARASRRTNR